MNWVCQLVNRSYKLQFGVSTWTKLIIMIGIALVMKHIIRNLSRLYKSLISLLKMFNVLGIKFKFKFIHVAMTYSLVMAMWLPCDILNTQVPHFLDREIYQYVVAEIDLYSVLIYQVSLTISRCVTLYMLHTLTIHTIELICVLNF